VLAAIQYMSSASWAQVGTTPVRHLSGTGIAVAWIDVVFVIINLIGVRWLANFNTGHTWKVRSRIDVIVFCLFHFHAHNFTAGGGFFIPGHDAVSTPSWSDRRRGIVFALLGFEQAVQLGGKVGTPADLPDR